MKPYFSKSKLISGWQCPKKLYLDKHHRDLAEQSDDRDANFELGNRVGRMAQELYGTDLSIEIPYNRKSSVMLTETADLLAKGVNHPIFEATFQHEGVLIRADVLIPDGDGWQVIEVKSSTKAKDVHKFDCAIQLWVMRGAGLDIKSISLAYIDKQFIYPGGGDYNGLIKKDDVTEIAESLQDEVPDLVELCGKTAQGKMPNIGVGTHCADPYPCEFRSTCWPMDSKYPIEGIGGTRKDIFDWISRGIKDIRDIPADEIKGAKRQWIYDVTTAGVPDFKPGAKNELDALGYPRYHLDFETASPVIPVFKGSRPRQLHAVQWSIHVDDGNGGGLLENTEHLEFLDLSGDPPMRPLAESLIEALGDSGPVFMWHHYERTVINGLIKLFPDLEPELQAIVERLHDLKKTVERHYYHPDLLGSYSIKKVLPVLVPHMNYQDLEGINEGSGAADGIIEAIDPATPPERKAELEEQLLRYCRFDTEAMVEIARILSRS